MIPVRNLRGHFAFRSLIFIKKVGLQDWCYFVVDMRKNIISCQFLSGVNKRNQSINKYIEFEDFAMWQF